MSIAKNAPQEWSRVLTRIERLESQNSRLRRVIGITSLAFAAITVMKGLGLPGSGRSLLPLVQSSLPQLYRRSTLHNASLLSS
jgi:hypothetical protein